MQFAEAYLHKHQFIKIPIQKPPSGLLSFIVVIPAYNEPDITEVLHTLKKVVKPAGHVEVIVVTNFSQADSPNQKEAIIKNHRALGIWCDKNSLAGFDFLPVLAANLPIKHAGVGLARKIGMDIAVERFQQVKNSNGIILSLDADSQVSQNYFTQLEHNQKQNADVKGWIFNFDLTSNVDDANFDLKKAAELYELYLRYYRYGLVHAGYENNLYTIGSCFAVQVDAYCKQGGMNRRQGGEDFYFLQKIFSNYPVQFISEIIIRPASRLSDRVPFGTGPILRQITQCNQVELLTYPPECFDMLQNLLNSIGQLYDCNQLSEWFEKQNHLVRGFLQLKQLNERLNEINQNTNSLKTFERRFIRWFDGLKVLQFFNYCVDKGQQKIPIETAARILYKKIKKDEILQAGKLLTAYRQLDSAK